MVFIMTLNSSTFYFMRLKSLCKDLKIILSKCLLTVNTSNIIFQISYNLRYIKIYIFVGVEEGKYIFAYIME